jgi:hypothetical protein
MNNNNESDKKNNKQQWNNSKNKSGNINNKNNNDDNNNIISKRQQISYPSLPPCLSLSLSVARGMRLDAWRAVRSLYLHNRLDAGKGCFMCWKAHLAGRMCGSVRDNVLCLCGDDSVHNSV